MSYHFNYTYIWQNGTLTEVPGLAVGGGATPSRMNNQDAIVGAIPVLNGSAHAFLAQNGSVQDLGAIRNNQYAYSFATDINDMNEVVGLRIHIRR